MKELREGDWEMNEYFKKRIHLRKEVMSFEGSCKVSVAEGELARRFKLALAKKLAEKEGVFEPTTMSLYRK